MKKMKKVIVGSRNPVKIEAVKLAFEKMFPNETFNVSGISISSGVSEQPMTNEETYNGALNRAKNCMAEIQDADFTVGLEGGLSPLFNEDIFILLTWSVVLSKDGMIGQASDGGYPLPQKFNKHIRDGKEEFYITSERYFKTNNTKQTTGTIGILTHGAIDRTAGFMNDTIKALIPHANKELYKEK